MQQIVLILHVLISLLLVVLVLLQQGKGANAGAAFGTGASQTVFGSQGSGSFMLKLTSAVAALFFVTSLGLGFFAGHPAKQTLLGQQQNTIPVEAKRQTGSVPSQQAGTAQTSDAQPSKRNP